jgi:peroxiredoxin
LLIGGATLAIVLVVLAVTFFSGGMGGIGGGGAGAPVGEVTEQAAAGTAPGMLSTGTAAPDLQWQLNGESGSLGAEKGHPVLLAFVATWCPHCQAEVAVLNRIQERFAAQGVRVIGVSASPMGMDGRSRASLGDMELFVRRHNARYPHLYDAGLVGAQRYGVRSFPTLYVIDGSGTIRYAQSGEVGEEELARAVQAALAPAA